MNNTNTKNKNRLAVSAMTGDQTRLLYPHVFQKYAYDDKDTPKYQVCLLIPKTDAATVNDVLRAVQAAAEIGSDKVGDLPDVLVPGAAGNPLHDGDVRAKTKNKPEYAGYWYLNAKATSAPVVCDAQRCPITDEGRVYGGVYARARIHFFAYRHMTTGIACSLDGIQIVRDGEPLPKPSNEVLNSFPYMDNGVNVDYVDCESFLE